MTASNVDIVQVKAIADKRIFCLYAALNATGYDLENHPPMHPVRTLARDSIAKFQPDLTKLSNLLHKYDSNHYYCFRAWVLHHGEPPVFPEINPAWQSILPLDIDAVGALLGDFWSKYQLGIIWEKVSPTYQQATIHLEKVGQEAVTRLVNYFKTDSLGIDEFVIIPNFLDSHYIGLGPTIGQTAFAILGPDFDNFTLSKVMHEFLHSIINPLTEHLPGIQQRSKLREYWIRAITIRTAGLDEGGYDKKRRLMIDRGYTEIDFFLEKLSEFEKGSNDFVQYFKEFPHDLTSINSC